MLHAGQYTNLWVPWSNGYLVHTDHVPTYCNIWSVYKVMLGVLPVPSTVVSSGRIVFYSSLGCCVLSVQPSRLQDHYGTHRPCCSYCFIATVQFQSCYMYGFVVHFVTSMLAEAVVPEIVIFPRLYGEIGIHWPKCTKPALSRITHKYVLTESKLPTTRVRVN